MRRIALVLFLLAATAASLSAQTQTTACSAMSLGDLGALNGWVPSAGDAWHQDISASPVDPNSNTIINTSGDLANRYLHPDFSNVVDGAAGIPYTVVDSTTMPLVSFTPYDADDSDNTLFPFSTSVPIEGNPGQCWTDSGDHHALVLDRATCVSYEVYQANYCGGTWSSYGNVIWDFTLPAGEKRPYGMSSVDAAGLSIFEGLIRYDEIVAGQINHAIRFTATHTKNDNAGGYFTAPAVHAAGNLWGTDNIMGMRIRLKSSFDISGFSSTNQIILTAMKTYGMILADNGGDLFFQGTPDPRWDDDDLNALKAVPNTAFEVVQMGPVYDAYSAPPGFPPTIVSFTASADNVDPGTPVTLTYDVQNGSYQFIDVVGFVRGPVTVAPTCTTTYTLWSRGVFGTSTASVTVNVNGSTSSSGCSSSGSGSGSGSSSGSGSGSGSTTGSQNPNLAINSVNPAVGTPVTLTATTQSTGALTWYLLSGPATLSGSTLTATGAGSVMVEVLEAADSNYVSATALATLSVGTTAPTAPTLAFNAIADQSYGVTPFAVSATSNSPGAITYSVVSGPATLSGSTVSVTGAGRVTLLATQAASGSYASGSATVAFNVNAVAPGLAFTAVAAQTYGASPFAVSASSNSTGAITYTVVSGPATVSGSIVTLTGAGSVVLQAAQAAAGNYLAASVTTSFTVSPATPTLSFTPVGSMTFGASPFAVSATSNSPAAITYTVVSGPATISGSTVTLTGVGTVTLQASQAASGGYSAAMVTTSFAVNAQTPSLAFTPIATQIYGVSPFAVSAASNSGGAITYAVLSGPATISGSTVTLIGTGTVTLQAAQIASGNYSAASATTSFAVSSQTPALAFTPIASQTYGAAPFAVTATSPSSGAITYAVISGPATVSGNIVTLTGAGTVVLQASQAAAGGYNAATATTTFGVAGQVPTLAVTPIANQTYGAAPFTVSASSNSSGAISYVVTSGPATVTGNLLTLTGTGTVTVQASQAGVANYTAAVATASFSVTGAGTNIAFAPIAAQTYGSAPFAVSATSNSPASISYAVVSGPATVTGNIVSLTGAGTVVLQASQPAATGYNAASVDTSFTVNAAGTTLAFSPISTQTYGATPFAVIATSNSPASISYAVLSGPAAVAGNIVSLSGAGTVTLQASQAASGGYAAATVSTSFNVSSIAPTLAVSPIATQTYGAGTVNLAATSNSPGAITYSVLSGPATAAGHTLTLTGAGAVSVEATQAAAGGYTLASATASFTVNPGTPTFTLAAVPAQVFGAAPITVSASSNSPGAITYSVVSGPAMITGSTVAFTGIGTVIVQASQTAASNFVAAKATTSFAVAPINPNLTIAPIATQTYGSGPITVSATSASLAPITFSVTSGPASMIGTSLALNGAGGVVLQATQPAAGNYLAATATVSFTISPSSVVLAGDFVLPSNITVTVKQGSTGTASIPVSAINGFSGIVNFQCTVPASMIQGTCNTTAASLTSATSAASTFTIGTRAMQTAQTGSRFSPRDAATGVAFLAMLLPCGLPVFSRRRINLRRFTLGLLLASALAGATLSTTGCASAMFSAVTAPGTYVIPVTAASALASHNMTVTVVVQPGN